MKISRDSWGPNQNAMIMYTETLSKAGLQHNVARNYIIKGLGETNFDAIPYDERVILRAPLNQGDSENTLIGKKSSRKIVGTTSFITSGSGTYRQFCQ